MLFLTAIITVDIQIKASQLKLLQAGFKSTPLFNEADWDIYISLDYQK